MVGIVLATHGDFAKGILMSSQMVFGDQEDVAVVTLKPGEGPEDFRARLDAAVASLSDQKEVLFLVDLWGGTPFNQASAAIADHEDWCIVTGLNLPMLIEAFTARWSMETAKEIAAHVVGEGRGGCRTKPEDVDPGQAAQAQAAEPQATGMLPPGTVVGDGQMKIVHVRIDSRLLHGQVATNWAKSVGCNRIIVVSDSVAHDQMRKSLIIEAAPPGVKANVTTLDTFAAAYHDTRMGNVRALVLFENPEDALALTEKGVPIEHINFGSLAHKAGKTMLSQAIAMDQTDADAVLKLRDEGVTFDTKQVPSSSSDDLFKLIKDNGLMP